MQNVFWAVARNLESFQSSRRHGAFRGWLWAITRNKIRDQVRAMNRGPQANGGSTARRELADVPDVASIPEEEPSDACQLQGLTRRALEQVRSEFESRTWQAFWRTAIDGIPTAVVAAELGVSTAAIRQNRSRVMRRLRQQLGDLDG
jgi:RNA polymerase sigma-70 factor (ECF subfamily)